MIQTSGGWTSRGSPVSCRQKTDMALTEDARVQATAGEEMTVSRRVHTVRYGQETAVVGITGLTTYDQ
jgi:hypothetical protein